MITKFFFKYKTYNLILFDQSIVSLGNFLISILILRFLGIEQFGIFSFFWIFLLLINSLQLSFIVSPMLTNATKHNYDNRSYYYGGVFFQQILFSSIVFLSTFIFLKFFFNNFYSYEIEKIYIPFSLLIISMQIYQFFRRVFLSKIYLSRVIIVEFILYTTILIFIIYINSLHKLALETIFWLFFYVFTFSALLFSHIIIEFKFNLKKILLSLKDNWVIGKWLILTSITQWFCGNFWAINAGLILGAYALGIIRACQTVLSVSNLLFQSMENIFPGKISKILKENGKIFMHQYIKKINYKGFLLITLVSLFIILFSKFLLNIFYGLEVSNNNKILIYLSLILPFTFLQYFPQFALRSLSKTMPIFISYLLSSLFAIFFSKFIINNLGIDGFILGMFVSQLIILITIYSGYFYHLKKNI